MVEFDSRGRLLYMKIIVEGIKLVCLFFPPPQRCQVSNSSYIKMLFKKWRGRNSALSDVTISTFLSACVLSLFCRNHGNSTSPSRFFWMSQCPCFCTPVVCTYVRVFEGERKKKVACRFEVWWKRNARICWSFIGKNERNEVVRSVSTCTEVSLKLSVAKEKGSV